MEEIGVNPTGQGTVPSAVRAGPNFAGAFPPASFSPARGRHSSFPAALREYDRSMNASRRSLVETVSHASLVGDIRPTFSIGPKSPDPDSSVYGRRSVQPFRSRPT